MHLCGTVPQLFGSPNLSATTVLAADPDRLAMFRQQAIKCVHGTVNVDRTQSGIIKGLTKRNAMETEMMVRQARSIRQMRTNQLSDTGAGMSRRDLEENWCGSQSGKRRG